jgi:hypothetical protein
MLDDNAPASGAVRPRLSVIVCSPGRCLSFLTSLCADVSKAGALPLGSPSFSIQFVKTKGLARELGSGTVYENVAPHAWSPPNFPHSERQAKVRPSAPKYLALRRSVGRITSNPANAVKSVLFGVE